MLDYDSFNNVQTCWIIFQGGNFSLQDGDSLYISSPNYPANYDSNTDISWHINMPEDCSLVLSVLSFYTENFFDALLVSRESGADQSVVLIDRFSSRLAPFNRTYAPSTLMRIQFSTDGSVVYPGFEAELRASCSAGKQNELRFVFFIVLLSLLILSILLFVLLSLIC